MIAIGLDRRGDKHLVDTDTREKHCGRYLALCGIEAMAPADPQPDDSGICLHCTHARRLGPSILRQGKKTTQTT